MATWNAPAVPVFPAGYCPQQADFSTWWYQVAGFLQNKVVARVSQATTATSLPSSGAVTVIGFDTVAEDPYSGWNATSHEWAPPAGYSGWYQVTLTVRTAPMTGVDLYTYMVQTSSGGQTPAVGVQGASNVGAGASGTWTVYLTGGQDAVQGAAGLEHASAAVSTSLTAGQQSTMEIVWLSQS
jgi:hypothetical protein